MQACGDTCAVVSRLHLCKTKRGSKHRRRILHRLHNSFRIPETTCRVLPNCPKCLGTNRIVLNGSNRVADTGRPFSFWLLATGYFVVNQRPLAAERSSTY